MVNFISRLREELDILEEAAFAKAALNRSGSAVTTANSSSLTVTTVNGGNKHELTSEEEVESSVRNMTSKCTVNVRKQNVRFGQPNKISFGYRTFG